MNFPKPDEYPDYDAVYMKYISESDNIINVLEQGRDELQSLISFLPENIGNYFYAKGKWSIKQVLGHLADVERVHSFRAMCFARGEVKPLPGFEVDDYVEAADFNSRSLSSLAAELLSLRNANIALFKSFEEKTSLKRGTASGHGFSVRGLIFAIAGHELHHIKILKEKYL